VVCKSIVKLHRIEGHLYQVEASCRFEDEWVAARRLGHDPRTRLHGPNIGTRLRGESQVSHSRLGRTQFQV
jgi:hypothetical protein